MGVHGKYGHELDLKLKLEFQGWLEETFPLDRYTLEEIRKKLDISQNAARSLSKLMDIDKGAYNRQKIIRTCMGCRIYTEELSKDVI
jgi:Zn-dependent peptidase ImmA (M78 family)